MRSKPTPYPIFLLRLGLILLAFGAIFHLAGCQRSLLYHPQTAPTEDLQRSAARLHLENWTNEAGERIGWKRSGDDEGALVLVIHGNAGHALHRVVYADALQQAARTAGDPRPTVFLLEYPGYGDRPGRPSESAFYAAISEAWKLLAPRRDGDVSVFLLGESIGSGGASWLAGEASDDISGIILITPFDRLRNVVHHHGPFVGPLLISERYDNLRALENFEGRLAVILAELDRVVPARFGQNLYDQFEGGPKRLWIQRGNDHNTLSLEPGLDWWAELWEFLN
jgi:hypothetical protein